MPRGSKQDKAKWDELVKLFDTYPGQIVVVSKLAGMDTRAVRRAWRNGWPEHRFGQTSIAAIYELKVRQRLAKAEEEQALTDAALKSEAARLRQTKMALEEQVARTAAAERQLALLDAGERRKTEAELLKASSGAVGKTMVVVHRMADIVVAATESLQQDIAKTKTLGLEGKIALVERLAKATYTTQQSMESLIRSGAFHGKEPLAVIQHTHEVTGADGEPMSLDEAKAWLVTSRQLVDEMEKQGILDAELVEDPAK